MPIPGAPSDSPNPLGDLFANVNRPQLNAFVANSQARNGLLSAQTQDAMIKAAQAQEEQGARENVYNDLIGMGAKPSEAMLGRDIGVGALGNAEVMAKALGLFKLGYGTPDEQVRGHQMATGNLATPPAVSGNYLNVPGTTGAYAGAPSVQQTPNEQAVSQNLQAEATLRTQQAQHPELFHGGAGASGPMDDNAAYNAAVKYNQWGVLPPLGMGGAARDDRKHILDFAANLSMNPNWHPPSWDLPPGAAAPATPLPPPSHALASGQPAGQPGVPGQPAAQHPTLQQATDVSANPADTKAQAAMLTDQTKRTANADASEQTALKQMQIVRDTLAKADQFGSPYANTIVNLVRNRAFGDPNVSGYQNALSTMRTEYARVISLATGATGITDFAMKMGQDLFPDDLAPAQFENNAAVATREMAARTGSMHQQIAGAKSSLHTPIGGAPVAPGAPPISLDDYLKSKGH